MSITTKLRIAVLQLNPRIGSFSANIERANELLHNFNKPLDLLVLPEFAFTGYNFKSPAELEPYLEPTLKGASTQWAQRMSQRLKCHTIVGYPERDELTRRTYNAAAMTGPGGEVLHNFRKSFLYMIDETFGVSEGGGFQCVAVPSLHGLKVQVGICMDINPYKFTAPHDAYEFATYAKQQGASLIVTPMNWTHSLSPSLVPVEMKEQLTQVLKQKLVGSSAPDERTINYWLQRTVPLFDGSVAQQKRTCFIAADRCGWEDDVLYAGSSSVFTFNADKSATELGDRVKLHGCLSQSQEGLLYIDEVEVDV